MKQLTLTQLIAGPLITASALLSSPQYTIAKPNRSHSTPSSSHNAPYKVKSFKKDSDAVLLARLLFGEARSCTQEEKTMIAWTVVNRGHDDLDYNGTSVRDAILKNDGTTWQYSCFSPNDVNSPILKDPYRYNKKAFDECLRISRKVLSGKTADPTHGANLYYNPHSMSPPSWTHGRNVEKIGHLKTSRGASEHRFFREY